MKTKAALAGLLLAMSLFAFVPSTYAITAEEIAPVSIYPDEPFKYKVKRLKEKVMLFVRFSETSKVSYQREMLGRRLSELKHIVVNDDRAHIEKTSQRYETTAGQLAESIIANNLEDEKDFTIRLLASHSEALNELKDSYPFGTAEYRFVMNDINSLEIYSTSLRSK